MLNGEKSPQNIVHARYGIFTFISGKTDNIIIRLSDTVSKKNKQTKKQQQTNKQTHIRKQKTEA